MKTRSKVAAAILCLAAGLIAIPVVGYALENRELAAERARVHDLIRVGQAIDDAQETLRQRGFAFHTATPTRYLGHRQLLVIIGDTVPSRLDALFYAAGSGNPLRTQSPYVVITADLEGVITGID